MAFVAAFLMGLIVTMTGCRQKTEFKEFSFMYTVESTASYQLSVTFDSDRNFRIERHNFLMDNHNRRHAPQIKQGTLTDEEYARLKKAVEESQLFTMEDSYGFEEESNYPVMYQISLTADGREKFVSIRHHAEARYPQSFIELIDQINVLVKDHRNDPNVEE